MDFFFNPSSVAVVGASPHRTGANLLANLLERFPGRVYPVNPGHETLSGRKCYARVTLIEDPVDLAIVLVPAPQVPDVLRDCAAKGVRGAMIESAGFAETGPQGGRLQDECLDIARAAGMRLWGPNCMGLVDVAGGKVFSFMSPLITQALLSGGRLSLVVQSGMLSAGFQAEVAQRLRVGFAKACAIGNMIDVDECDVLEYLLDDPQTEAVVMYLEGLKRGRRFIDLASRAAKPIVVLKSGQSASGARAALSHTASLAGDARLTTGLLRAAGVELADDFHQMMALGQTLALLSDLSPRARVAVLTFSGGAGILSCDLLERGDLRLAELTETTRRALAEVFPPWQAPENPVDLWPSMDRRGPQEAVGAALEAVLADPEVDLVLIHLFLGIADLSLDLADLKQRADRGGKALAFWVIGLDQNVSALMLQAYQAGIMAFTELGRAAECLAAAARYRPPRPRPEDPAASPRTIPAAGTAPVIWDEYEAKRLLADGGVPVVDEALIDSVEDALAAARDWGWPVVLKGLPPGEAHKSEKGLVELNLVDEASLRRAFDRIQARMGGPGRIVVQRQVRPDYELIAGFLDDPGFGPVVMLGRGGIYAEVDPDVAFDLAPLDRDRALALMGRLRVEKLFDGRRGVAPLDRGALADLICRLGELGLSRPDVSQVDVNPVAVVNGRPIALDATIVTGAQSGVVPDEA